MDPRETRDNLDQQPTGAQHDDVPSWHGVPIRAVSFDKLAAGKDEIWIELDGQFYRLRKTRNGKLILNK